VWSRDKAKALEVAKQMRTGTVWINDYHLLSVAAPFGGYKQSGIGREFGLEGILEYTEVKHVHVDQVDHLPAKFWCGAVFGAHVRRLYAGRRVVLDAEEDPLADGFSAEIPLGWRFVLRLA